MNYHVMWLGADPCQTIVDCIRSLSVHHPDDCVSFWTDTLDNKPAIRDSGLLARPNMVLRDAAELEAKARASFPLIYRALDAGHGFRSRHAVVSDMFRLVAVRDHGGAYVDADTMIFRNLNHLFDGDGLTCFEEAEGKLCAGIFSCSDNHESLMEELIALGALKQDFDRWGFVGPLLFNEFWRLHRSIVRVFEPEYFFALHHEALGWLIRDAAQEINVTVSVPLAHGLHLSHEYLRRHGKQHLPFNVRRVEPPAATPGNRAHDMPIARPDDPESDRTS